MIRINNKDKSAVIKVERMTKASKEANHNSDCDLDSTDDEDEDVMDME